MKTKKLASTVEQRAYYTFKHSGWLEKRVDRWEYVGDAQWRRCMSLDVNYMVLRSKFFGWDPKDSLEASSSVLPLQEEYLLPLFEIEKSSLFTNFDLRDQSGKAMSLAPDKVAREQCLNALMGAIEEEPTENGVLLAPLRERRGLMRLVQGLFDADEPLRCTVDGSVRMLSLEDEFCEEAIRIAAHRMVDLLESRTRDELDSFGWSGISLDGLKDEFDRYYDSSRIFRYFVKTYTLKKVYFALVGPDVRIIKIKYDSTRDLFQSRERPRGEVEGGWAKWAASCTPFCTFSTDIDCVTSSECGCMTIAAPEGMVFVPSFRYVSRRRFRLKGPVEGMRGRWFHISDKAPKVMSGEGDEEPGRSLGSDVSGRGSLVPGYASLQSARVRRAKSDSVEGGKTDFAAPMRRLPVDGNGEHLYRLELALLPVLGRRAVGYGALVLLSLALFALYSFTIALGHDSFSDAKSAQIVLSLVPAGTLFAATMDQASYIRRKAFLFPRVITWCCALCGTLILFELSLFPNSLQLAVLGLVLSAFFAACYFLWLFSVYRAQRLWMESGEFFNSFEAVVRAS